MWDARSIRAWAIPSGGTIFISPDPDIITFDDTHRWLSVIAESVEMVLLLL
jgi:hypothetical protein